MRISQYFNPFYDFARRQLSLSPKVVDQYLENHATAAITGRTVTLTYTDAASHPHAVSAHVGLGHTSHATEWVNEFNNKVTA